MLFKTCIQVTATTSLSFRSHIHANTWALILAEILLAFKTCMPVTATTSLSFRPHIHANTWALILAGILLTPSLNPLKGTQLLILLGG
jgi:hypothetical protein